jgi:hypothetical protein
MVANSSVSQPSVFPIFKKLTPPPLGLMGLLISSLVGGFVGIASWNPNLGLLSASASFGLNLLDPSRLRSSEIQRLREEQQSFKQLTTNQLKEVQCQLEQARKIEQSTTS